MTTEPLTPTDLGHPVRYPLRADNAWRATCRCHWWWEVKPPEEKP